MVEEEFYTLDESGNRVEHRYTPIVIENPQGTAEMMAEAKQEGDSVAGGSKMLSLGLVALAILSAIVVCSVLYNAVLILAR